MTRKQMHHIYDRALMWVVLVFFVVHMGNHLAIYMGADAHIAVMDALRAVYRFPVIEILLIWAILRQTLAGIRQLRRFGVKKPKGVLRVLVYTGIYLIGFLGIHISAISVGRYWLGLDTNIYFGGAGYRSMPAALIFYPYYFLAVLSGFAHWGAVLWMRNRAKSPDRAMTQFRILTLIGLAMAVIITLGVSGVLSPFAIPDIYLDTYR